MNAHQELAALEPKERHRVMDLVQSAGVDVSDWANFGRGPRWAAANPRYCYEWAFAEPGKIAVLNVWYDDMRVRGGRIILELDPEQSLRTHGHRPLWRGRIERQKRALQTAWEEGLPIRAVVCLGRRRDQSDPDSEPSRVEWRELDPVPWEMESFEPGSGRCTLWRGVRAGRLIDQFDVDEHDAGGVPRREVVRHTFERSPEVRRRVLERAAGRCECCGAPGFAMANGEVYLETHHIQPLSEGGADVVQNVVALCANHHREAHHGARRATMRESLLQVAAR